MSAIPFATVNLDIPYELRLDMAAMVSYEQLTGEAVFALLGALSFTQCVNVVWTCLHQKDEKIKQEDVIDLIEENCDVTTFVQESSKLITGAFKKRKGKSDPNVKSTQTKN